MLLLMAPIAAAAGGDEYWSYSFRNVEVTAAGNSAYATNLARYCVRLDGMLTSILGIRTAERPHVHIYALPEAQVRRLLGAEGEVSYHGSRAGAVVVTDNSPARDSDYWGSYFGYTAALLATDGQLRGPDWYRQGLPVVFANTKYKGDRATLGTVQVNNALMLGQGSALIPMRTFLTLERASISGKALETYDSEAWGLVHEVFVEGWHRAEFVKYLGLLRQGSSAAEAFPASFKVTYEQLDKEFAYALRQRAYVYTMNAPDPGSGGEPARLLTADEVQVQLDSLAALYGKSGSQ
jgi:hypothetical protein